MSKMTRSAADLVALWVECMSSTLPDVLNVCLFARRSSLDDYCPPEQVEQIQSGVLNILQTLFGSLDVHEEHDGAAGASSSTCC